MRLTNSYLHVCSNRIETDEYAVEMVEVVNVGHSDGTILQRMFLPKEQEALICHSNMSISSCTSIPVFTNIMLIAGKT